MVAEAACNKYASGYGLLALVQVEGYKLAGFSLYTAHRLSLDEKGGVRGM